LFDETLPRPVRARLLAAQLGRNFTETISALIRFNDDAEAVARHFHDEHADAARCRRRDDPPAEAGGTAFPTDGESSPRVMFEPILICKSWSEPIVAYTPCPPPPDNAAVIDEMVSRGVLARAVLATGRTVYASPDLARYLSAVG
jgi:hypothetical protein